MRVLLLGLVGLITFGLLGWFLLRSPSQLDRAASEDSTESATSVPSKLNKRSALSSPDLPIGVHETRQRQMVSASRSAVGSVALPPTPEGTGVIAISAAERQRRKEIDSLLLITEMAPPPEKLQGAEDFPEEEYLGTKAYPLVDSFEPDESGEIPPARRLTEAERLEAAADLERHATQSP